MRPPSSITCLVCCWAASASAAIPVEMEIFTERGLQVTATRQWLQLLDELGVRHARLRAARRGTGPQLENRGTAKQPRYYLQGVLTGEEQLQLPGGRFALRDRDRLRDYLQRLIAEGIDGVTAPRGRFDLTEQQFRAAHRDLSQPIGFVTKGVRLNAVIQRLNSVFEHKIALTPAAQRRLGLTGPATEETQGLTAGTGLALLLRSTGLCLRPEMPGGQAMIHRVMLLPDEETIPSDDAQSDYWPVGWKPDVRPAELAPEMFEFLNVQIEGYTLREALDALGPRIDLPIYLDHAALAKHKIVPDQVQITVPKTRTYYKRLLDRMLFQARLHGELRVDEAGTIFYWITR